MNKSVYHSLERVLTPHFIGQIATFVGEDKKNIYAALNNIFPYLYDKVQTFLEWSDSPNDLLALVREIPELDMKKNLSENLHEASAEDSIVNKIHNIINPDDHHTFKHKLLSASNIKSESVPTLTNLAIMLLFKPMKDYLLNRTMQSPSLKSWLMEDKHSTSVFKLHAPGENVKKSAVAGEKAPKKRRWWWLLLLLLLILGMIGLLRGCFSTETHAPAPTAMWKNLGKFLKHALPDGKTLSIPEFGVENKLISYINSDEPISDTRWFSFDRLLFETNSATLMPASQEQLTNIADIMKAYPRVNLLLGGYTDNTGTDEVNMQLSQQRADSVRQELIKLGVPAERLSSKGYGSAHPVAPNDTDENRAKNRRIDIQVTQK